MIAPPAIIKGKPMNQQQQHPWYISWATIQGDTKAPIAQKNPKHITPIIVNTKKNMGKNISIVKRMPIDLKILISYIS